MLLLSLIPPLTSSINIPLIQTIIDTNGRSCIFTMDEEIENQKYQIKREEDSSEKSKGEGKNNP